MPTILLAEDNELNRQMLVRRLTREGFTVVTAVNGVEALTLAQSAAPALILMDMSMPVMTGWEATRQLKATPAVQSIPVIALTAHALEGDREKALQAGCDDYETKPIDFARLFDKMNGLLTSVEAAAESTSPRLLVVDDHEMKREVVARRLECEGYAVTLARTGKEALHLLKRQLFDLVLVDVMMPEINGLDVLRVIRAGYSISVLPVIMLTANEQSEDVVAALRQGANDYVTKPIHFPVLIARLRTQLAIKQDRASTAQPAPKPLPSAPAAPITAAVARSGVLPAPVARRLVSTGVPSRMAGAGTGAKFAAAVGAERLNNRPVLRRPMHLGTMRCDGLPAAGTQAGAATLPEIAGYEILKELGRGGMGVVYQARHVHMNRIVALKVFDTKTLAHPDRMQFFFHEIQAAAQLAHRNVVLAYDAGQYADLHYFAMEYVEGIDLTQLVKQDGPLRIEDACDYVCQTARGLQHICERGLVHRDLKPSNLILTQPPLAGSPAASARETPRSGVLTRASVKILDLGVALLRQPADDDGTAAAGLTRDGHVVGTADYMAPEQWVNAHRVDVRADVYSLGCTLYFLLAGQVPFPGDEPMEKMLKHHVEEPQPLAQLRPSVPAKLVEIVCRMMAKKPALRYQQPDHVAEVLRSFLPGKTLTDV